MEELQEADVLWPDHHHCADDHLRCRGHGYQPPQRRESTQPQPHHADAVLAPRQASSAPVGIPEIRSTTREQDSWARRYCGDDDDGGADRATFVAPHEMAARRRCEEERSVCVGHGRTLKGRDLRSVRTAVLRMTGFLET
jgi:hypothetical protein